MAKNNHRSDQLRKKSGDKRLVSRRAVKAAETAEELHVEEMAMDLKLRRRVDYFSLSIFTLNAIGALTVVFLVGFGQMVLSNNVLITLILETVAHGAAVFMTITRSLFQAR